MSFAVLSTGAEAFEGPENACFGSKIEDFSWFSSCFSWIFHEKQV